MLENNKKKNISHIKKPLFSSIYPSFFQTLYGLTGALKGPIAGAIIA